MYNLDALDAGVDTPPEEGSTPTSVTLPLADGTATTAPPPFAASACLEELIPASSSGRGSQEPPPWEKYLDAETVETPAAAKPDTPAAELADPEDVDAILGPLARALIAMDARNEFDGFLRFGLSSYVARFGSPQSH